MRVKVGRGEPAVRGAQAAQQRQLVVDRRVAGDVGEDTNAWVGHGLWFFAAYAVLSWLVSQRLSATVHSG